MLTICLADGTTRQWHVGEELCLSDNDIATDVTYIQADGDELSFFLSTLGTGITPAGMFSTGIPRNIIKWYGDMARFILGNACTLADSLYIDVHDDDYADTKYTGK